jgi:NADPH2:quinone reductase
MRAVVVEEFGDADVLKVRDCETPAVSAGAVLIDVRCAGVNFAEILSRRSGYLGVVPPFVPGMEVAGVVREVGTGVDRVAPGDAVCAMMLTGGYAETALANAHRVFRLPSGIDWAVAAALPVTLPTAHALLHELGRVRPGDRVLVNAAAGGTGMVLGQMARASGVRAVGIVSSPDKVTAAQGYEFEQVLTTEEVDAGAVQRRGFDLILDSVGGAARASGWDALAPFGTLVAYGNASGAPEESPTPVALRSGNHKLAGFSISSLAQSDPELLAAVAERSIALVADGIVHIDIGTVVPLERAADAHRDMEARRTTGKTVLTVN